jgi:hypothetical protein
MRNRTIFLRRRAYIEEPENRRQVGLVRRGKVPVLEGLVRISACVGGTIAAQNLGRVVLRIEAHTQEMRLLVERGIGRQRFVNLRKVPAHSRTEVSQRTARIDERHQQHLAMKLR